MGMFVCHPSKLLFLQKQLTDDTLSGRFKVAGIQGPFPKGSLSTSIE
jgi:hypothetical protein